MSKLILEFDTNVINFPESRYELLVVRRGGGEGEATPTDLERTVWAATLTASVTRVTPTPRTPDHLRDKESSHFPAVALCSTAAIQRENVVVTQCVKNNLQINK